MVEQNESKKLQWMYIFPGMILGFILMYLFLSFFPQFKLSQDGEQRVEISR